MKNLFALINGFSSSETTQFNEFEDDRSFSGSGRTGHDHAPVRRKIRGQVFEDLPEEPVPADEHGLLLALRDFEEEGLQDPLLLLWLLAELGELD